MTELSSLQISEIVTTRISHDLIGNIGAVANAVELMEEGDTDFLDDIKSILNVSSKVLSARLKFFRMAFGLDNANLENMELVGKICRDYLDTIGNQQNYPIGLKFNLKSPAFTRMAMLEIMVLADLLIKGGTLEVEDNGEYLAAAVSSEAPLSTDKINHIKEIENQKLPENLSLYAPFFFLKEVIKSAGLELKLSERSGFGIIIG